MVEVGSSLFWSSDKIAYYYYYENFQFESKDKIIIELKLF